MTDIEKQALALVNEVRAEAGRCSLEPSEVSGHSLFLAICRALEQKAALQAEFDQFRQDVSDTVEAYADKDVHAPNTYLGRFILPKPVDPLVEVMNEMGFGWSQTASDEFRQALAKRGLKIVEAE